MLLDAKEAAARAAVIYVQDGMTLGIGTGSTAAFAIQALGERVQREGLRIKAVPTSVQSKEIAVGLGIPLIDLSDIEQLDLTIDGADEVDPSMDLIKGGGGALLREKLVASASRELIIICDNSKIKSELGAHPLPVAVVPFGHETTLRRLRQHCDMVILRPAPDGNGPYITDDGCYIFDMHLDRIPDPTSLAKDLKQIVGVVEVGLFVGLTSRLVIGYPDGHTEERVPITSRG